MVGNSAFRVRASVCALGILALAMSGGRMRAQLATGSAPITVDYPLQNSVFPPEFPAPLADHDPDASAGGLHVHQPLVPGRLRHPVDDHDALG